MQIEELSSENLPHMIPMLLKLLPDLDYQEEMKYYGNIIQASDEKCYLARMEGQYIAFAHLKLRTDYVEGSTSSPVVYLEAIYVEPGFRKTGIGKNLVNLGESWGSSKHCSEYASDTMIHNVQSIDFHKSVGFKEAGRLVSFIKKII